MYTVIKTYGHDLGLSACFRQWRAKSHCSWLHGYALSVELEFEAQTLDERNWVLDFGGMKDIKQFLVDTFDHSLLVAADDPYKDEICALAGVGVADVIVLDHVGCEAFAAYIFAWVHKWLDEQVLEPRLGLPPRNPRRLRLRRVTVREHGANAASYEKN